jgi:hypothetical protein
MKTLAQLISLASLAGTIVPPMLFFMGSIPLASTQSWMLGAAVAWFLTAPLWMER